MLVRLLALAAVLLLATGPEARAAAGEGSWENGQLIASGGRASAGATACFTCHGIRGEGDAVTAVPRLNGLAAFYLAKQMRDFAKGTRPDPVMTPIAEALTAQEIEDVAVYYAAMPYAPPLAAAPAPPIYMDGDPARGILPCRVCHGSLGVSAAPAIPTLAGQPAVYTERQLLRWQRRQRANDPLLEMTRFSQRLTTDEIAAIAAWLAGLTAPRGSG